MGRQHGELTADLTRPATRDPTATETRLTSPAELSCTATATMTKNDPTPRRGREYERRSGTGQGNRLGYEKKKGGSGKGNWGNPMEDYETYKEERMRKTTN